MSATNQETGCSAVIGTCDEPPWDGYPLTCGRLADGPNLDGDYREPLCAYHRAQLIAERHP